MALNMLKFNTQTPNHTKINTRMDFDFLPSNFASEQSEQQQQQQRGPPLPPVEHQHDGDDADVVGDDDDDDDDDLMEAQLLAADAQMMPPPPIRHHRSKRSNNAHIIGEVEDGDIDDEADGGEEEEEEESPISSVYEYTNKKRRKYYSATTAASSAAEVRQLEAERLRQLFAQFTPEQHARYTEYTRSNFPHRKISRLMSGITNSSINKNMTVVMSGISKIYVGELVELARSVMAERGAYGPIRPEHLREAYRRMKQEGKVPRTGVNSNVLQRSSVMRRKFRRM